MANTMKTTGNRADALQYLTVLVGAALLSGCAQTKDWLDDRVQSATTQTPILGAPAIDQYVKELGVLASDDAAAHAEIFADAEAGAMLTPNPSTNLRFGLVLAIPGHPESDAVRAQSILREVLTQTELLTQNEISLATIHLNSVERQIVANAEARRLRETTSRTQQTQDLATQQRLARVESENRRLRQELEEAERKLDAITSIEQTIRDQE